MVDLVDSNCVVEIYMKLFPTFFGYAEVNKICIATIITMIEKVSVHPLFVPYKNLFVEWHERFTSLQAELMGKAKGSSSEYMKSRSNQKNEFSNRIGYSDLDFFIALHKWLRYHKLHKYVYFFANISYEEFMTLDERNIFDYDNRVGVFPITDGARGTILRRMAEEIHPRPEKLQRLCDLNFYKSHVEIETCLTYLKKVLHTPIRKPTAAAASSSQINLPRVLENAITIVLEVLMTNGSESNCEQAIRVLQSAYSCHFFTHTQKSKFNTLRCRLKSMINRTGTDDAQAQPQKVEAETRELTEDEILLRNLSIIEAWLSVNLML